MSAVKQLAVFSEHELVVKERNACADLTFDVRMMVQTDKCSEEYRQGWVDACAENERLIRLRLDPTLDVVAGRRA